MRSGRRRISAAAVAVLLALVLPACTDENDRPKTIGVLRAVPATEEPHAFLDGLAEKGYGAGRIRFLGTGPTEAHPDPADAEKTVRGWVDHGVDLILALSTTSAMAAAKAAPRVPVLFLSNDPTVTGLLRSERHPEGHLTGAAYRVPADRMLAIAADALGELHQVACLVAPDDPATAPVVEDLRRGTEALKIGLNCASMRSAGDVDAAVRDVVAGHPDAVVVVSSPTMVQLFPHVRPALAATRLPVITSSPADFAVVTLEPDPAAVYRQLGHQAARLLGGAKVLDVPVEDPGHFLLIVNEAAAKRIGRTIPADVLKRADQVIR